MITVKLKKNLAKPVMCDIFIDQLLSSAIFSGKLKISTKLDPIRNSDMPQRASLWNLLPSKSPAVTIIY